MNEMQDFFTQMMPHLLGTAAGAVGAYVAIRSDLAALRATVEILSKSLDRAHVRIDELHK